MKEVMDVHDKIAVASRRVSIQPSPVFRSMVMIKQEKSSGWW